MHEFLFAGNNIKTRQVFFFAWFCYFYKKSYKLCQDQINV